MSTLHSSFQDNTKYVLTCGDNTRKWRTSWYYVAGRPIPTSTSSVFQGETKSKKSLGYWRPLTWQKASLCRFHQRFFGNAFFASKPTGAELSQQLSVGICTKSDTSEGLLSTVEGLALALAPTEWNSFRPGQWHSSRPQGQNWHLATRNHGYPGRSWDEFLGNLSFGPSKDA